MTTTSIIEPVGAPTLDTIPLTDAVEASDAPGVVITLGVEGRETTFRQPWVDDELLTMLVLHVWASTGAADVGYLIGWHEGAEDAFVQAAVTDGQGFRIEIHDGTTPAGHCLVADGKDPTSVTTVMYAWLTGWTEALGVGWRVVRWGD